MRICCLRCKLSRKYKRDQFIEEWLYSYESERGMKTKEKWLYCFLILAVSGYVIKNFFVGADVDEGYGILLGYRLAVGDKLLLQMWEPHQTSAIFTALFVKPFMWITGGI